MNIQSAINQGAQILKNKFFLNPYLDSEILMSKVLKKKRDFIILNYSKSLDESTLGNGSGPRALGPVVYWGRDKQR